MARIRPGNKTLLLVVDVQVDVMRDAWDAARVVANVARAVERARAQGVPVAWVQHEADDLPHGSPGWQWVPELAPRDGDVRFHKRFNSAFEDTPLDAELARLGIARLVLAGAATNWCIRATAYAALERGYDLVLVSDAHTTTPLDAGDGRVVPAQALVDDLNAAMSWLEYPGRTTRAVTAAEVEFS